MVERKHYLLLALLLLLDSALTATALLAPLPPLACVGRGSLAGRLLARSHVEKAVVACTVWLFLE